MEQKPTQYQCSVCSKVRNMMINVELHQQRVSKSPNGLGIFSDIHRCKNGILGINNCQIDHNYHTRSFDPLTLPVRRKEPEHGIPGLPTPASKDTADPRREATQIMITEMLPENSYRITIDDAQLGVIINIGNVKIQAEFPISEIISDLGTITLKYYPCDVAYTDNLERSLSELTNLIEVLPPTTLGLFIETLRFIHSMDQEKMDDFYVKQLKTILSSHETYFMPVEDDTTPLKDKISLIGVKYGEELAVLMQNLLSYLEENPLVTLQQYAGTHHKDLTFLINAFLIMEQEGIVEIERPGIVTDPSAMSNLAHWLQDNP